MKPHLPFAFILGLFFLNLQLSAGNEVFIVQEKIELPKDRNLVKPASTMAAMHSTIVSAPGECVLPNLSIHFDVESHISGGGDQQLLIKHLINNLELKGVVEYRGFDLLETFLPQDLQFTILVKCAGGTIISSSEVDAIDLLSLKPNESFLLEEICLPVDLERPKPHQTQLQDLTINYSPTQLSHFREKVAKVDHYYKCESNLLELKREISRLKTHDSRNIENVEKRLDQLRQEFKGIRRSEFLNFIKTPGNDPANLRSTIANTKSLLEEKDREIQETIAHLFEYHYNLGLQMLGRGLAYDARRNFDISLDLNPGFSPTLFELARLDFNEGKFVEAEQKVIALFEGRGMGAQLVQQVEGLAGDLHFSRLDYAQSLIQEKRFSDAERELDHVLSFCDALRCLSPGKEFQIVSTNLRTGQYQEMLNEASYAFQRKQLKHAEESLVSAQRFANSYAQFVVRSQMEKQLEIDIKQEQHSILLGQMRTERSNGNLNAAFEIMEEMRGLETSFSIRPYANLNAEQKELSQALALQLMKASSSMAESNNLTQAYKDFNRAQEMAQRFGFENLSSFQNEKRIAGLAIGERECINANVNFKQKIQEAGTHSNSGNFLKAEETLQSALALGNQFSDCGLNVSEVLQLIENIRIPVTYQKEVQEAKTLAKSGNYHASFSKMRLARSFFSDNNVGKHGLKQSTELAMILDFQKPGFLLFATEKYISENKVDDALSIVNHLSSKGLHRQSMKTTQRKLGEALARRDVAQGMHGKPKDLARRVTGRDRNLKFLEKQYRKTYKALR